MNRCLPALAAAALLLACTAEPGPLPPRPAVPPRAPLPVAVAADAAPAEVEPQAEDPLGLPHEHPRTVDHLGRADELKSLGDLEGALAEARRAVHDDPLDEEALAAVARLARLTADLRLSADAWERLALILEEDSHPCLQQGRALLDAGDPDGALLAAERARARDEGNPEVFQLLGRAYLARKQLSLAAEQFREAVALDPEHGHALNNLGLVLLRTSQHREAADVLRRAADLLPTVAHVHNNLGIALERLGDTEGAREAYEAASRLSPRYVKAALNKQRVARAPSAPDGGAP